MKAREIRGSKWPGRVGQKSTFVPGEGGVGGTVLVRRKNFVSRYSEVQQGFCEVFRRYKQGGKCDMGMSQVERFPPEIDLVLRIKYPFVFEPGRGQTRDTYALVPSDFSGDEW